MIYFAYGSNMSRRRLEERVGAVEKKGRHLLKGYKQTFTKEGLDKSGKGNIELSSESHVYGVAYVLTQSQFESLKEYEKGYDVCELTVEDNNFAELKVHTFIATKPSTGLSPTADYFAHYLEGMEENNFPDEYIEVLSQRAGLKSP